MTFKTFGNLFNSVELFLLLSLFSALSAQAQGISEAGAAYSGSMKSAPTTDSVNSLGRIFKQATQGTPTKSANSNDPDSVEATVKKSIKEANKDCLLAQEKEKEGKLLEAQKLYSKALAIRQRIWGANDPAQATILYKIAALNQQLGNTGGAELCLKQALGILAKHGGPGNFEAVPVLEQLAKITMSEQKYADAEGYYERILALQERKNGLDSPIAFTARLNLIDAALALKDYKEAKDNLDHGQEIYTKLSGKADLKIQDEQKNSYLQLLDRYINVLNSLHKPEEAQIYAGKAAALRAIK